ncbi:unnamed protein product, partial [Amoebophrya sp. A25]
ALFKLPARSFPNDRAASSSADLARPSVSDRQEANGFRLIPPVTTYEPQWSQPRIEGRRLAGTALITDNYQVDRGAQPLSPQSHDSAQVYCRGRAALGRLMQRPGNARAQTHHTPGVNVNATTPMQGAGHDRGLKGNDASSHPRHRSASRRRRMRTVSKASSRDKGPSGKGTNTARSVAVVHEQGRPRSPQHVGNERGVASLWDG